MKQVTTLRLDAAVLRWFQESGPGYQSRIGAALKSHMTRMKGGSEDIAWKGPGQEKGGIRLRDGTMPSGWLEPQSGDIPASG